MEEAKKALEQERSELNALIGRGVSFEVQDVEVRHKTYLWGLFKKKVLVPITRNFVIEEPTLGTLDRLSSEWVEMAIDEEAIKSTDGMLQARIMTKKHALRCAKVIALAVLGSDYLIPKAGNGGIVRYEEDTKRLEELARLFARQIKPSELYQLYVLINAMCNLGDFLNSIRLMSADRTTIPIRIEESNEG
ncbi:hypothetical protein HMPREF1981_02000 [Bacteroides pyogenes F0041]|uniref:Uncharacterized protein n=1 Tax=Bacteroides pyogenes F0041 TaxID=1321819 RepID=U2CM13_9BACE|nr:hypothetical protein [Bacteroides pyogenes]ERI85113.1 hypothetical protein HMPREF1981_02000 [Bacteroides pyogenes F0041]